MSTTQLTAEAVVVGSEILEGRLPEANLVVIAAALRRAGVPLERAAVLPDDEQSIVDTVRAAAAAVRPRLLVVCGGTGGTWDDVTYAAVAKALGRGRAPVAAVVDRLTPIIEWTRATGYDVEPDAIDSMMNIALVPKGSRVDVIDEWLVAVTIDVDGGIDRPAGLTVLLLPGPPGHCARLVDEVLAGRILAGRASTDVAIEVEHGYPETLLTGSVLRVRRDHPAVRVGSYPGATMVLRIVGPQDEADAAADEIRAAVAVIDAHPAAAVLRSAWATQRNWAAPAVIPTAG